MKINVTENKVSIKEEQILNENEYNIHKIQFDFSSEYTDDLVKVALFSIDNHTYKKIISNNECDIPPEVLTQRGYSILGVYAYKTEQDTLVLRYSPSPTRISVYDGSYKADAENSEPITPSEIEQYQQILQNSLQQFQNQYNALVEETEGDIQAIEDELQRKVDEGYFDGEDGFSPIAKVIQKSNGATIEIEDKNGKTTADVLNGEDGYTPVRGVDYWTEEDKQEVKEEATQQIEGKIEEYNENAAEKLNQYNQNSVQKTNDYNTNAEQKMSAYNTNATEKFNNYNSNAEQKETNYNTNASQKVEAFNTNASSKLSEYNTNATTKKTTYDENATQKTTAYNTNATNKLTEYNTNHTEKMSAYNSNSTQKLNAFNENAVQKTEDFDAHTEEIQDNIEILQRTDNQILSRFNKDEEVSGQDITLTGTTEIKFAKPPLPMGNSEQVQYSGKNLFDEENPTGDNLSTTSVLDNIITISSTATNTTPFARWHFENLSEGDTIRIDGIILDNNGQILMQIFNGTNWTTIGESTLVYIDGKTVAHYVYNVTSVVQAVRFLLYADKTIPTGASSSRYKNVIVTKNNSDMTYEPYVGGTASPNPDYPQPITNVTGDVEVKVQNKNLLPNNLIWQYGYVNGSGNWNGDSTHKNVFSDYIYLKAGIYTISYEIATIIISIAIYDKNKTFIERNQTIYTTTPAKNKTFTLNQDGYIRVSHYDNTGTQLLDNINSETNQLEIGSTSTDYVEHKEQVFTFPLGNEKLMLGDYLADDGIHHVRGQYAFTGNENIQKYSQSTYAFGIYTDVNIKHSAIVDSVLCNKLQHTNLDTIWRNRENTNNNLISSFTTGFCIMMNNYTDVNDLKEYLTQQYQNETPVIAEYELQEEVIVPYTSAQQRVYNEIKNAYSYDEMTIITGSSDENKPFFTVQAYKDLNKELNNKVDKVQGKELSSNDFTDTLKEKLEGLENYDDTEIKEDISGKQDITDNTLTTINKTVPTAINEVNSIAKLANQAKSYSTYQAFINYLNTAEKTEFIPGQSFMIQTKLVPDLWVYSVENTSVQYTYTTDEDFITYTNQATGGQVGYYKLAQLETQKVDLTDYATKTYVNNLFNSIVDGDEVSY